MRRTITKKDTLVGQPGGPIVAVNASLYGATVEGMARPEEVDHVYGMVNGIEGFLSGHITDLPLLTRGDLSPPRQTPAVHFGSCHFKLPEDPDAPVCSLLFEELIVMSIGACFYIGGNGSMDTADKLFRYVRIRRETISFVGVPKAISDGLPVTDHTPGYGSAAKYVASTACEVSLDASVHQQPTVIIMELMGRHAGWVTAASALARKCPGDNPPLIYMPEVPFSMEQFFKNMKQILPHRPNVVICVSEGMRGKKGRFICEYTNDAQIDTFDHKMLIGCIKTLESYIRNYFRVKVRSAELNVSQCCNSLLASAADVKGAECSGGRATEKVPQEETGKMVTCSRLSGSGYEPEYGLTKIGNVCNHEKSLPVEWIIVEGSDIEPEFLDYALPLIQGQPDHTMENGLPKYLYRK